MLEKVLESNLLLLGWGLRRRVFFLRFLKCLLNFFLFRDVILLFIAWIVNCFHIPIDHTHPSFLDFDKLFAWVRLFPFSCNFSVLWLDSWTLHWYIEICGNYIFGFWNFGAIVILITRTLNLSLFATLSFWRFSQLWLITFRLMINLVGF